MSLEQHPFKNPIERNAEFLDALGLYVEDVMKSAELQCKELEGYADGVQQASRGDLG